jgi:O-methyltransferase
MISNATKQYEQDPGTDEEESCVWYHSVLLPGFVRQGDWDIQPVIDRHTGGVGFSGKTCLDIGTASGALSFHMEKYGGNVTSFDQSDEYPMDTLPFWGTDLTYIRKMKNGFWKLHRFLKSRVKVVYGNIYELPFEDRSFDVAVIGNILLHTANPWGVIEEACRVADTVIVTDVLRSECPDAMVFRPAIDTKNDYLFRWSIGPTVVERMLRSLGFKTNPTTTFDVTGPAFGTMAQWNIVATRDNSAIAK